MKTIVVAIIVALVCTGTALAGSAWYGHVSNGGITCVGGLPGTGGFQCSRTDNKGYTVEITRKRIRVISHVGCTQTRCPVIYSKKN